MREAQGTKGFDPKKAKYPCYASIKLDGTRALKDDIFYTRGHNKIIGVDHIEPRFLDGLDYSLDGEMMVRGHKFDSASGLLRNHQPVPDAYFMVFDAPELGGTLQERYVWLYQNLIVSDDVQLIDHVVCENYEELMAFYNLALAAGEEGIMYKSMDSEYKGGKSWDWMRMVPIKTADCKVIGFFEGKGKFAGTLGGIIVEYKGKPCKVGTGFNEKPWDDLTNAEKNKAIKDNKGSCRIDYERRRRHYIWLVQAHFMNDIAECEYKEESKNGVMRQPRFKGWRWDKNEVD